MTSRKHHCRKCGYIFCSDCLRFLIQIKAEISEVDELKQYQPMYKFNYSEKHRVIELKVCEECFQALKEHIIGENRLKSDQSGQSEQMFSGLDASHLNPPEEDSLLEQTSQPSGLSRP